MSAMTRGSELLRLVQHQGLIGRPLPFGVRDEHGTLLLAKGQVVADEAHLQALLARGVYVDAEAMWALSRRMAVKPMVQRRQTLFDQWAQLVPRLDALLRSVAEPNLPERVGELSVALIALRRRDPDICIYLAMRQDEPPLSNDGLTHAIHAAMVCSLTAPPP